MKPPKDIEMKSYIVLSISEDGDYDMQRLSGDVLTQRLNEEYYGNNSIIPDVPNNIENVSGIIIIDGDIVVPVSLQTLVNWVLP